MGKQEGVNLFTGSIGNLSFYKIDGIYYVRKKSGVSRERIMKQASYEVVRRNMSEFTHASQSTKLIRRAFASLFKFAGDKYVSGRLTGAVCKVVKSDPVNTHGKRNIRNGDGTPLQGFNLHRDRNLSSFLFADYTPSIDRGTGVMSVDIAAFSPDKMISAPQGATHFRLHAAGASIDFEANTFSTKTSETIDLPIDETTQGPLQLKLAVPVSAHPMFLIFGIEFLQHINGKLNPLESSNAMTIVKVDGFGPQVLNEIKKKTVVSRTLPRKGVKSRRPVPRSVSTHETPLIKAPSFGSKISAESQEGSHPGALMRWAPFLHPT